MARPTATTPTDAELQVLRIVWRRGPCTARQIWDGLPRTITRQALYDMLETLVEKQLLKLQRRRRGEGGSLYLAQRSPQSVLGRLVRHLASLFGGAPSVIMQSLLESGELSEEQLKEMQDLIRQESKRARRRR